LLRDVPEPLDCPPDIVPLFVDPVLPDAAPEEPCVPDVPEVACEPEPLCEPEVPCDPELPCERELPWEPDVLCEPDDPCVVPEVPTEPLEPCPAGFVGRGVCPARSVVLCVSGSFGTPRPDPA